MQRTTLLLPLLMLVAAPCWSENGYVTVLVQDARQRPVRLVEMAIGNGGSSKLTKDDGKAQLPVGRKIRADDWITFQLVHSPPGKDLAIVSPWDNRIPVPSFTDKPENVVKIVVVQRGDRAALESGLVLTSLAAKINKANAPKTTNAQVQPDPTEALRAIAEQFGLTAQDIDAAIRTWGAKTTDPYETGVAALYERNYPKASSALQDSLDQRERKLDTDQKAVGDDQKSVADAAFFLGQSRYGEGLYRESAQAYQKCLTYRPNDAAVLNNMAISLAESGDYRSAEFVVRRAILITEGLLGADHYFLATELNNLGIILSQEEEGDGAAEPLYRRALAIDEVALGPDHPDVARDLGNLAILLQRRGDNDGAEVLFRRAIRIDETALGPGNPSLARDLDNFAFLLKVKGDLTTAESLVRRALAIDEAAYGPNHPEVAHQYNDLAILLQEQGDDDTAKSLISHALKIDEAALGPEHPSIALFLRDLALIFRKEGNYSAVEPIDERVLAIHEKTLGPNHPTIAIDLNNLAEVKDQLKDYTSAESLLRRALAIDEKALGPNKAVAEDLENLAVLSSHEGSSDAAESFLRRALAIDEKALGPDDPATKRIRQEINTVTKPLHRDEP